MLVASGNRHGTRDRKILCMLQLRRTSGTVNHCPSQLFRNVVDKEDEVILSGEKIATTTSMKQRRKYFLYHPISLLQQAVQ